MKAMISALPKHSPVFLSGEGFPPENASERLVPLTPSLRRKLLQKFNDRYEQIDAFLRDWQERLGEKPPDKTEAIEMIYATTYEVRPYSLVNGACHLLLDAPYRDNSRKNVPPDLKKMLIEQFERQFKSEGKISWSQFFIAWQKVLSQCKPPRRQTLQIFFYKIERNTCEHWLADGLCRLLLGKTYEGWLQEREWTKLILEPLVEMEAATDDEEIF